MYSSDGQFFGFVITSNFRFLKVSESKNLWLWVFKYFQIASGSGILNSFEELVHSKENKVLAKNQQFRVGSFTSFWVVFHNRSYGSKLVLWFCGNRQSRIHIPDPYPPILSLKWEISTQHWYIQLVCHFWVPQQQSQDFALTWHCTCAGTAPGV